MPTQRKPFRKTNARRVILAITSIAVVTLGVMTLSLRAQAVPLIAAPPGIDAGNKFILAQGSGGGSSNGGAIYDPLRRIVKIVETRGGTVTSTKQFVWAGDQLCEERDASSIVTKRFYALGEQISGNSYYFTRDKNDSVREMTDSSGRLQCQFDYDPYGRPAQIAGTGVVPDFGYAGMYVHQPSGLNLAVNRVYDPNQGRWISRDPLDDPAFGSTPSPEPEDPGATMASSFGQGSAMPNPDLTSQMVSKDPVAQGRVAKALGVVSPQAAGGLPQANPYTYAANNPVNMRDPSGLTPSCFSIGTCQSTCRLLYPPNTPAYLLCVLRCVAQGLFGF